MIVLDLTIFSIQKIGGISVVWSEYLKRLHNYNNLNISLIYPFNNNTIAQHIDLSKYKIQYSKPRGPITKYLPFLYVGHKEDVLHTSYYQWYPLFKGTKIVTLHDFMHEMYAPLQSRILHNVLKYLSLKSADVVLCISKSTRDDFKRIYPAIYKLKDVRVVENAVGDHFYEDKPDSRFLNKFLWVAGRSGYKNFKYALKIISYLKKCGKLINLVIVGPPLSKGETELATKLDVLSQIEVYSNVDMDMLRVMYSSTYALLYLSKYEGFGLPILEAQKCRCPVIVLKNSATEEVGEKSVLYMDENPNSILPLLDFLDHKDDKRQFLDNAVVNSNRYNWDESLKKLVAIYSEYDCRHE